MVERGEQQREARRQLAPVSANLFASLFGSLRRLSGEIERLFEGMRGGRPRPWHGLELEGGWLPDIEVFEEKGQLVVRADVPGMSKDDVTVTIGEAALTIEGERKLDTENKGKGYYRSERAYGQFHRCVGLPEEVDVDNATASFKNGVLEVTMPAPTPAEKQGRRLEIAGA